MSSTEPQRSEPDARFAPAPGVIETDLESELVLLDPSTQEMFSLNPSGRALWLALRHHPLADAAAHVADEFDVDVEQATSDALALLDQLLEAGLLRRADT